MASAPMIETPPPQNQFNGRKFIFYLNTSHALYFCIMSVKVIHVHGYDRASISVRDRIMPSPYSCSFSCSFSCAYAKAFSTNNVHLLTMKIYIFRKLLR